MALWRYSKSYAYEVTEWRSSYEELGADIVYSGTTVAGYDQAPEWNSYLEWYDEKGAYLSEPVDNVNGMTLYDDVSNSYSECSFIARFIEMIDPGTYRVLQTKYLMRREGTGEYEKGSFIEEIIAEYGTYPEYGYDPNTGYWYEALGPVWTPPDLRLKVAGAVRTYNNGWVKVGGQLREINKMWVKVNGVLREVKEQ